MIKMELKIRMKSTLVGIRNGMIVDTHLDEPQDNKNKWRQGVDVLGNVVTCIISPHSIAGLLRRGISEYLRQEGISSCASFDIENTSGDERKNAFQKDINNGYHYRNFRSKEKKDSEEKKPREGPQCMYEYKGEKECLISEMFGGMGGKTGARHRKFILHPMKLSPKQLEYDNNIKNVTGKGNFRQLIVAPRSMEDNIPFAYYQIDTVGNMDGIQYITIYNDVKPDRVDIYTALFMKGVEFLNIHKEEFNFQLGGFRTSGYGIVDYEFLPTFLNREQTREYHKKIINKEEKADQSDKVQVVIDKWPLEKTRLEKLLSEELKIHKELFGIDKKWCNKKHE